MYPSYLSLYSPQEQTAAKSLSDDFDNRVDKTSAECYLQRTLQGLGSIMFVSKSWKAAAGVQGKKETAHS